MAFQQQRIGVLSGQLQGTAASDGTIAVHEPVVHLCLVEKARHGLLDPWCQMCHATGEANDIGFGPDNCPHICPGSWAMFELGEQELSGTSDLLLPTYAQYAH